MNPPSPQEGPLPLPAEGGFLVVDKPCGPTSHQVTAWVRDILGVEKAGHTGTLDPAVSGVLVIGFGRALRLLPLVLTFPKRYVTRITLHGEVRNRDLERVLSEFEGPIYQTPPVRSAVRRERRVRTIHHLRLLDQKGRDLLLDVSCDSGTYVRTLATDLGEALGAGAHMAELRRIATGPFGEDQAVPLWKISDAAHEARAGDTTRWKALLQSPKIVWGRFPQLVIKDSAVDSLAHGADLAVPGVLKVTGHFAVGDRVVLVTRRDELVALGTALRDSTAWSVPPEGYVVDAQQVLMEAGRYPSWNPSPKAPPSGTTPG